MSGCSGETGGVALRLGLACTRAIALHPLVEPVRDLDAAPRLEVGYAKKCRLVTIERGAGWKHASSIDRGFRISKMGGGTQVMREMFLTGIVGRLKGCARVQSMCRAPPSVLSMPGIPADRVHQ